MKKYLPFTAFVVSMITFTSALAFQPCMVASGDDLPPYFGKDNVICLVEDATLANLIASDDLPPYFGKDSIEIPELIL